MKTKKIRKAGLSMSENEYWPSSQKSFMKYAEWGVSAGVRQSCRLNVVLTNAMPHLSLV